MISIRPEGSSAILGLTLCATIVSVTSLLYPSQALKYAVIANWVLVVLVINFFRDPSVQYRLTPV